jgi:hypothetical protein
VVARLGVHLDDPRQECVHPEDQGEQDIERAHQDEGHGADRRRNVRPSEAEVEPGQNEQGHHDEELGDQPPRGEGSATALYLSPGKTIVGADRFDRPSTGPQKSFGRSSRPRALG